jgi:hypothetical protein
VSELNPVAVEEAPTHHPNPEKLRVAVHQKPPKKMPPGPPTIMICVPVGTKDLEETYTMPGPAALAGGCDDPKCSCKNHGKHITTHVRGNLMVPLHWALAIPNVLTPLNTTIGYLTQGGMLSADARNLMTKKVMEIGSKYIFYWDDDVLIPYLTLYYMHHILENNPDIGLVTGVYTTRENPPEPLVYKEHGSGAWWGFSVDPEHEPEDIYAAGGGCIMARMEDVAKMEEPYWHDEQVITPDGKAINFGHDIRFIRNFREQTGKRTVVKGSILCGHYDAGSGETFNLPKNSLPYKRLGNERLNHELTQLLDFSPDVVERALRETNGEQRLFLVDKQVTQDDIRDALAGSFDSIDFVSVDNLWLAVCEGLKNGWTEGRTDSPGQSRNGPRARSKRGVGKNDRGARSPGKRKRPVSRRKA